MLRDYSHYLRSFERHLEERGHFDAHRTSPAGTCFHRVWDLDTLEKARHLVDLRDRLMRENEEFRLHI